MGFSLKSVFGGGNPLQGLLGGGSGGSSSMTSGGIGSSTGNTNANLHTTTTTTANEDRRLVIGEGGVGVNSESSPLTMNLYQDATNGEGFKQLLATTERIFGTGGAAPNGTEGGSNSGSSPAETLVLSRFLAENKTALMIGGAVVVAGLAVIVWKGKK